MNTPDNLAGYLLPYQRAWLQDKSRYKIWEKSRRIGATYVQALEDVMDAAKDTGGMDVWFSSKDESAAKEYIRYCKHWAQLLNLVTQDVDGETIVEDKDIRALAIQFANGKRIHGLSSNPDAFRSKGGKLVIDEFAFHPQAAELWKAAAPIITWGFPVRIISTHNGKGCRYYHMVEEAKNDTESHWSLHTVTIHNAVKQGLADKIHGRKLDQAERESFVEECRMTAGDADTFAQEYCCIAVDETTAWLPYDLIHNCVDAKANTAALGNEGEFSVGMDIGRKRDLTVIWVAQKLGDVIWQRKVVSLHKTKFSIQKTELCKVIAEFRPTRVCIDETSIGTQFVEEMQELFGKYLIEGVMFTNGLKHELAVLIKQKFEDRQVRISRDDAIIEAHHAIKKTTTSSNKPRFDAERTDAGHADEFWAHALAVYAFGTGAQAFGVTIENFDARNPDYGMV